MWGGVNPSGTQPHCSWCALREELARFDAVPEDSTRLVRTRLQLRELVGQFLPETNNQIRDLRTIDNAIRRLEELGFLRAFGSPEADTFEVMRILKARFGPAELQEVEIVLPAMPTEKTDQQPTVEPGFRLERLELWNWGTFNGAVQVLEPAGGWACCGDNGSGKSTAIDALRTLLVPPRLLNYNDASGDGRRPATHDRSRRSYVRGAWANSSTIDETKPTIQYLREAGVLSAIAALFDKRRQTRLPLRKFYGRQTSRFMNCTLAPNRRTLGDLVDGHANTTERSVARLVGRVRESRTVSPPTRSVCVAFCIYPVTKRLKSSIAPWE